jgi:hypothetical protein
LAVTGLPAAPLARPENPGEGALTLRGWAGPDLDAARRAARETGRPILLLIRSSRCPACDVVEDLLLNDPDVAPLTDGFIRVLAPVEEPAGKAIADGLSVNRLPALVVLGPAGKEATRSGGAISKEWMTETLQVVSLRHQTHAERPPATPADLRSSLD